MAKLKKKNNEKLANALRDNLIRRKQQAKKQKEQKTFSSKERPEKNNG